MNTQWLTLQSFQQGQDLVEAINTILIHTKLQHNGNSDTVDENQIQKSRDKIKTFLQALTPLVAKLEENPNQPLLGVDSRRRQLVDRFVEAKKHSRRFRSGIFKNSIDEAVRLLELESDEDQQKLIESLSDLRTLIEEHIGDDTVRILGEF